MRFLKTQKELTANELPLRVFGSRLCGRCHAVQEALRAAGIAFDAEILEGQALADGVPPGRERHEAATVLAAVTWQDGLLPVIVGHDWESVLPQKDVERFLA